MQFDGHATNQDLASRIDFLCDSDDNSYTTQEKVLSLNTATERVVAEIINADGVFQWDDTNFTNLPVATGTLVEAQEDYSFDSEYLQSLRVEVLDANSSKYREVPPFDPKMLPEGSSVDEYFAATGFPEVYDLVGDTIFFYPAPTASAVTLASGLKLWFKRTIDFLTTSDTAQEPGIASPFHDTLAYMAAIPYCMKYHPDRVAVYQKKVDEDLRELIKYYSQRDKDTIPVLTPDIRSFR